MRFPAFLCLAALAFCGPATAAKPDMAVATVPIDPAVSVTDITVSNPDGSQRVIQGPYIPVRIEFRNNSGNDDYTVSNIGFAFASPTDFLEEDAQRDFRLKTLKPHLKISPGGVATTEVFYLEELPEPSGADYYVSISITGWLNTGADAGDRFTMGAGFKAR